MPRECLATTVCCPRSVHEAGYNHVVELRVGRASFPQTSTRITNTRWLALGLRESHSVLAIERGQSVKGREEHLPKGWPTDK